MDLTLPDGLAVAVRVLGAVCGLAKTSIMKTWNKHFASPRRNGNIFIVFSNNLFELKNNVFKRYRVIPRNALLLMQNDALPL